MFEALSSKNQPLDTGLQASMEAQLGSSFAEVRVHTDEVAARSAGAVGAAAYTVGRSIVFGSDAFAPHSPEGRRLLAHELVHTIQQGSADPRAAGQDLLIDPRDSAAEREARHSEAPHVGKQASSVAMKRTPLQVNRGGDMKPGGAPTSAEDFEFQRPDPPKPGSPEANQAATEAAKLAAYKDEQKKGRVIGELIADAKKGLATLQGSRDGRSAWDTMSPTDRARYLKNIGDELDTFPGPGTYNDPAVAEEAKRGFEDGVGEGETQTAVKYLAVWLATELAVAIATNRAARSGVKTPGRGLGASGAGVTAAEIDKVAAARYEAIRKAGTDQLATLAKNTGQSAPSLKRSMSTFSSMSTRWPSVQARSDACASTPIQRSPTFGRRA